MNPEDDPEARIRALEQPLSDQAQASELGGAQPGGGAAYLPPPASAYSPPDYQTPAYDSQQYGTAGFGTQQQPYGTQPYDAQQPYGTQQWGGQQWGAQPQKVSGGIPWVIFAVVAVVFLVGAGGAAFWVMNMRGVTTPDDSSISSGGGSIDISIPPDAPTPSVEVPSAPNAPGVPAAPSNPGEDPNVVTGAPGQTLTVSGIDENKTIACNDATVTISGIRNTVNITGHCAGVSVSGIENTITVDAADTIGASGFDNKVTFHSGSPQIDATGSNTVQQG